MESIQAVLWIEQFLWRKLRQFSGGLNGQAGAQTGGTGWDRKRGLRECSYLNNPVGSPSGSEKLT